MSGTWLPTSLGLAAAIGACGNDGAVDRMPHVASESCPLKTPGDWQNFVETSSADPAWVQTCSDQNDCATLEPFATRLESDVLGTLQLCSEDLANNPPIEHCTARLRRYIGAWQPQHATGSYGFAQDNASYLAAHTASDVPAGMMDPPFELIAALPERARIEAAARDYGWPYLTHDSCLGGVRTFVTVADPEGRFDQWLLFGLDSTVTVVDDPSIVSFIGVQKKDAAGRDLPAVRLHFRDYLVSKAQPSWALTLPENFEGKCYACHGSGMRQLIPSKGTILESAPVFGEPGHGQAAVLPAFAEARLAALNERMLSYGLPDWEGTIEPADHGPPLGQSLGCTHCHDGETRGVLTVSTSEGMLRQKVVDQLSMRSPKPGGTVPDEAAMALLERETSGEALSAEEQAALESARAEHLADYEALVAERFPAWQAWVLEQRCE